MLKKARLTYCSILSRTPQYVFPLAHNIFKLWFSPPHNCFIGKVTNLQYSKHLTINRETFAWFLYIIYVVVVLDLVVNVIVANLEFDVIDIVSRYNLLIIITNHQGSGCCLFLGKSTHCCFCWIWRI
jgi:hypothetical protein